MNLLTNRVLSATLFATSFAATASHANARPGTFTLPFEAHWGTAVLEPGEYTICARPGMSWPQIIEISGHGKTVSTFAAMETPQEHSASASLRVLNVGERHFIQQFSSGPDGKSFTFLVPKAVEKELAAKDQPKETLVAVAKRH